MLPPPADVHGDGIMVRGRWESGACKFARKSASHRANPATPNQPASPLITPDQQLRRTSRTTTSAAPARLEQKITKFRLLDPVGGLGRREPRPLPLLVFRPLRQLFRNGQQIYHHAYRHRAPAAALQIHVAADALG